MALNIYKNLTSIDSSFTLDEDGTPVELDSTGGHLNNTIQRRWTDVVDPVNPQDMATKKWFQDNFLPI